MPENEQPNTLWYYCDACGTPLTDDFCCPVCGKRFLPPQQDAPGAEDGADTDENAAGKPLKRNARYAPISVLLTELLWLPVFVVSLIFSKGVGYAITEDGMSPPAIILLIGTAIVFLLSYSICKERTKRAFAEQPFFGEYGRKLTLIPFLYVVGSFSLFCAALIALSTWSGSIQNEIADVLSRVSFVLWVFPIIASFFHGKKLLNSITRN